jgi:hypothetical protein
MLNPKLQCSRDVLLAMGFTAVSLLWLKLYHYNGSFVAAVDAGLSALIAILILLNMLGRML